MANPHPMYTRNCNYCGKEYNANEPWIKWCSTTCCSFECSYLLGVGASIASGSQSFFDREMYAKAVGYKLEDEDG